MANLIINDLTSLDDLVDALRYLIHEVASNGGQDLYEPGTITLTRSQPPITDEALEELVEPDFESFYCYDPDHRDGCSCRHDAAMTDPRNPLLVDPPRSTGPVPYQPCISRGTHDRLTDCWMCWSAVHRGAIQIAQALKRQVS